MINSPFVRDLLFQAVPLIQEAIKKFMESTPEELANADRVRHSIRLKMFSERFKTHFRSI